MDKTQPPRKIKSVVSRVTVDDHARITSFIAQHLPILDGNVSRFLRLAANIYMRDVDEGGPVRGFAGGGQKNGMVKAVKNLTPVATPPVEKELILSADIFYSTLLLGQSPPVPGEYKHAYMPNGEIIYYNTSTGRNPADVVLQLLKDRIEEGEWNLNDLAGTLKRGQTLDEAGFAELHKTLDIRQEHYGDAERAEITSSIIMRYLLEDTPHTTVEDSADSATNPAPTVWDDVVYICGGLDPERDEEEIEAIMEHEATVRRDIYKYETQGEV
jgi:hypothetical protein